MSLALEKELWCGQLRRVIATLQSVLDCAEKYDRIPADTLPRAAMNLAIIHGNAVALEYEERS